MDVTVSISSSKAVRLVSPSTETGVLCPPSTAGNHLYGRILVSFLSFQPSILN